MRTNRWWIVTGAAVGMVFVGAMVSAWAGPATNATPANKLRFSLVAQVDVDGNQFTPLRDVTILVTRADANTAAAAIEARLAAIADGQVMIGSGVAVTVATNFDSDVTITVADGGSYRLLAENGRIFLGIAAMSDDASISVPANIRWAGPPGQLTDVFKVPSGTTTLYATTNSGAGITGYLIRVK